MYAEWIDNWEGAYDKLSRQDIASEVNLIASQVVYKFKYNGDGGLKIRSKMVLHGKKDSEKEFMRNYCAAGDMMVPK